MFSNYTNRRRIPKPIKGLIMIVLGALFLFLVGHLIQFLWNEILVDVTGVKPLNYWQSIGLFVLARILFGGFRFRSRDKWKSSERMDRKDRWMQMSNDQKAEMKAKWKDRCRKRGEAKD